MIELDHLSYSSIALYCECPAKWRYRYIEKVPTRQTPALAFGSAVHTTIEMLLIRRFEGRALGNPVEAWASTWRPEKMENVDWSGEVPEEFENLGARLFANPDVQDALSLLMPAVWTGSQPAIEQRIELRVPGVPVPIIGYLDMLGGDGVIVDFKTAARRWTPDQAQQETQPLFYLAALNQMGIPHRERAFRHVVFVKGSKPGIQILDTERSTSELLWLSRVIAGVWRAIDAGHFPMNPKACYAWGRPCEYIEICRGKP